MRIRVVSVWVSVASHGLSLSLFCGVTMFNVSRKSWDGSQLVAALVACIVAQLLLIQ